MEAGQLEIQKALNNAFVEIKVKNPNISLRAFANRLSISPSSISEPSSFLSAQAESIKANNRIRRRILSSF